VGATTIYVTHDQIEAMTMGDRVAVLRKGRLQQVDDPQRLFDEPANLFVASFIGSPEMNLLEGTVERDGDALAVRLGDDVLPAPRGGSALGAYVGRRVAVGIRPEYAFAVDGDGPRLHGRLRLAEPLGAESLVHAELDVRPVLSEEVLEVAQDADAAAAAELRVEAQQERSSFLARFAGTVQRAIDEPIEIGTDVSRLYFFDLATGVAIR
jgi:multiple sugar transport system ATP-binding protein